MNELWTSFWYFAFILMSIFEFVICFLHVALYAKVKVQELVVLRNSFLYIFAFLGLSSLASVALIMCYFFDVDIDFILFPIKTVSIGLVCYNMVKLYLCYVKSLVNGRTH